MAKATPWVVLLCKFLDKQNEPFTAQYAREFFTSVGTPQRNMVTYWHEVSHDHVDLSGNQVVGWITIPRNSTDYTGSGANPAGRDEIVAWAKQAAADNGVTLQNYYGVIICLNVDLDYFGQAFNVVIGPTGLNMTGVAHEMGHGYMLSHSRAENSEDDYQNPFDIMSAFNVFSTLHPNFGISGPALNAIALEALGWLDPARVHIYPGTGLPQTVRLRPLLQPELPGPLIAKNGAYLVEYRRPIKWDGGIGNPTVLIHRLKNGFATIQLSENGTKTFSIGDRFEKDNVRIRVNSIEEDAAVVELQYRPLPIHVPQTPCQWMRSAIRAQRRVVDTLNHKLELATSDAERDELNRQLVGEYAQLDAIEQDYAVHCPGRGPI
jgi:hypothetical protein